MQPNIEHVLAQSDYGLDSSTGIWSRSDFGGIDYSDGDETERRLNAVIDSSSDITLFSAELRSHCTDWPSTYHLSSIRANILRPFQITVGSDVLEIGAGCGALSRYLGECGANVLALEGSLRRARITRARTRDLSNVTVLAERLSEFVTTQKFDFITLIGVLEYAGLYTASDNPAEAMLAKVASMLKPNGVVIIAIENQLGLKYFAGAPEDHIGLPMYGLEGRYEGVQPRTYGRKTLSALLRNAGLPVTSFLAPFPDYKLPISILSETGVEREDFDGSAFAWQSARRDPQLPGLLGFAPERVWSQVFQNGLGLELANSFLVVASAMPVALPDRSVLAWHYSADRAPQYGREAIFSVNDAQQITVTYQMLFPELGSARSDGAWVGFKCPETVLYTSGQLLSQVFLKVVGRDGWSIDEIGSFIRQYADVIETLLRAEGHVKTISSATDTLPGRYLDVIAQNVILRDDGVAVIIDNEWTLKSDVEFGHCALRSLLLLMATVTRFGHPVDGRSYKRKEFAEDVFLAAGFAISKTDIARYIELEASIQEQITGQSKSKFLDWLPNDLLVTQNMQSVVAELDRVRSVAEERLDNLMELRGEVERAQLVAEERLQEIKALRGSTSWKTTAPLRRLAKVLRRDAT